MRIALNNRIVYYQQIKKIQNSSLEKPGSNLIVDPGYYKNGGLISPLINKFRNSNAIFELRRNMDGFLLKEF